MPVPRKPRPTAVMFAGALALAVLAPSAARAQDATTAFTNARVLTMAGPVIEAATLVVRGRTIIAAGRDAVIP